jgi:hypothetical protein
MEVLITHLSVWVMWRQWEQPLSHATRDGAHLWLWEWQAQVRRLAHARSSWSRVAHGKGLHLEVTNFYVKCLWNIIHTNFIAIDLIKGNSEHFCMWYYYGKLTLGLFNDALELHPLYRSKWQGSLWWMNWESCRGKKSWPIYHESYSS